MELIIIISLEITGIKLLPKIREFNDFFLELTAERLSRPSRRSIFARTQHHRHSDRFATDLGTLNLFKSRFL